MRGGLVTALACLGLVGCVPDPAAYPGTPYAAGPGYSQPYGYAAPAPAYGYGGPAYDPGYLPGYGGGVVVVPPVGLGYGRERERFDRERGERERHELERTRDRGLRPDGPPFGGFVPRPDRPYPDRGGPRLGGPSPVQPAAVRPPPPAPPPASGPRTRRPDERG